VSLFRKRFFSVVAWATRPSVCPQLNSHYEPSPSPAEPPLHAREFLPICDRFYLELLSFVPSWRSATLSPVPADSAFSFPVVPRRVSRTVRSIFPHFRFSSSLIDAWVSAIFVARAFFPVFS